MPESELASFSITNAKGQYWQVGQWVSLLRDATKYASQEEAFTVIGIQTRRFHGCDAVPNPRPIVRTNVVEVPWEFPHKEVAEMPYGVSLYGFQPDFPYAGNTQR